MGCGYDGIRKRLLMNQGIIQLGLAFSRPHVKQLAQVALGVHVDHQDTMALLGQHPTQGAAEGGFPRPSFHTENGQ